MSSFRFPPPPPPPPKASSNETQDTYSSSRGGRGGRGDRGRGRGGQGRGRGNSHNNSRGGHLQQNAHNRGGSRGGWQNHGSTHVAPQQPPFYNPPSINSFPHLSGPPQFPNPAMGAVPSPQVDPSAFAQAMSLTATQPMNTFAINMPGGTYVPQQSPQPPGQGTNKRTRQERGMQHRAEQKAQQARSNQNNQQASTKPPRAKAKAAPAVPSFGFALPTASKKPSDVPDPKRRKLNLGLTSQSLHNDEAEHSSEEEADLDEEALWASNQRIKNGVVFEHEGETISLQTEAELAAWRKDRRNNFPTQQRIAEKAEEAKRQREHELEFLARVTGKARKRRDGDEQGMASVDTKRQQPKSDSKNPRDKFHDHAKTNDAPPTSTTVNLNLGYTSDTEASAESSILSDSSVLSPSEDSSSDDDSDSDAPPTPQTTKTPIPPPSVKPPPPSPSSSSSSRPQPSKPGRQDPCPQFSKTGRCKYGRHCRYPHPPPKQDKFMSLYERMVDQELEKEDRLVLDCVKFLGRNGFLG